MAREQDGVALMDMIKNITTFLNSLDNSESIFSLLHQVIYECFPNNEFELVSPPLLSSITVSSPSSSELHSVSLLGLDLLALTGRHTIHEVMMNELDLARSKKPGTGGLVSLASLQGEQIRNLCTSRSIQMRRVRPWSPSWTSALAGGCGSSK